MPVLPEVHLFTPSGVILPIPGGDADATVDAMPESDDAFASTSTFSFSGEDSMHNTAHPSAAFLLASRQRGHHDYDDDDDEDDELDHNDSFDDSLDAAGDVDAPVHPFVRASVHGDYEDDSFEYNGQKIVRFSCCSRCLNHLFCITTALLRTASAKTGMRK